MKSIISMVAATFLMCAAQSAFACAGFGLLTSDVTELLAKADQKIVNSDQMKETEVLGVVWSNIQTESGMEGDCEARGINANVSVTTKKTDVYCTYTGTVRIFESRLGNSFDQKLEKDQIFCN